MTVGVGTEFTFTADYADQTGWFDPDSFVETVTVIGLGGIGASMLPTLGSMGVGTGDGEIVLWDTDRVDLRNVASQLIYKPSDLGRLKTEVCKEYLEAYGATNVRVVERYFTADDTAEGGVVISGVDSMKARQEIWRAIKDSDVQFYLDGRIGGLQASLFAVEPFDGEWYEQRWLFDDDKAAPLPCAQRAIAYPAVALGALIASHLVNWHRGQMPPKRVDFDLGSLFLQKVGKRD